jgi:N-acetylmuramoyl-L-alanine amidase
MQRGDDVSALQTQLGSLGFDAGRIDGIFGVRTDTALAEFQRNAGLVTDSICGPATVAALGRLGVSCDSPHSSASVRERERVRSGPSSLAGRLIAVGETGGLDALARSVSSAIAVAGGRTLLLQHPDGSEQAQRANTASADAYIGLGLTGGEQPAASCSTAYYRAPTGWQSPEGQRLAVLVQEPLPGLLGAKDGGIRGMAFPVLRETRMPAVVAELGPAAAVVERGAELAAAVTGALRRWLAHSEPQ